MTGHVYKALFEQLKPATFVDPMVGSGTSVEVAREMGIEAVGLDLHSGFDALSMSILAAVGKPSDLVLSHPAYGGMIVYSGPGGMWGEEAHPSDLSRCIDDEDFNQKLQMVLLNQREATGGGGYYGTIIGDWRRNGQYSCYMAEAVARAPKAELAAVLIKQQHNQRSSYKAYGKMRLPFITHEYILLWQKPRTVMSALALLKDLAQQQSQRLRGTWRAVVRNALAQVGGKSDLPTLYKAIESAEPDRIADRAHWKEKVRQTLQLHKDFERVHEGVWALAAGEPVPQAA
jgi:hypothetical protein